MKTIKIVLIISSLLILSSTIKAQNITADTTLAKQYFKTAIEFFKTRTYDSSAVYYHNSAILYQKHNLWEKFLESETFRGLSTSKNQEYDKAIYIIETALDTALNYIKTHNVYVAKAYLTLGVRYQNKSQYDKALVYYLKSLEINKVLLGEKHAVVASTYNNIGVSYWYKSEYDKSLEYYFKSLEIKKELLTEKHIKIANAYNNIGIIYWNKSEFDKSLEYYLKSLEIFKELLGEKHKVVATSYNNIGSVYMYKSEFDKSLIYYFKSLEIRKELLKEKHIEVANSYSNIGIIYEKKFEYDKSLKYNLKSLEIYKELLGEKHISVAASYSNLGTIYLSKSEYDKSLEYQFKSLKIYKELFGEKHSNVAIPYTNIGSTYAKKLEYDKALKYYQRVIAAVLPNFNDTLNISAVPKITNYLDWKKLAGALQAKAKIFSDNNISLPKLGSFSNMEIALQHYQACDTLISQVRIEMKTKSDKIALGEIANSIYQEPVPICLNLAKLAKSDNNINYKQLAFQFTEKNKSSVLSASLDYSNALKFGSLPDSILTKEKKLQKEIAKYTQEFAAQNDSIKRLSLQSKLFTINREYEALTTTLETDFPEYFNLKKNRKIATIAELQGKLDKKTALVSYLSTDSLVFVSVVTKKTFNIYTVTKEKNFDRFVQFMRKGIVSQNDNIYTNAAHKVYKHLFPKKAIPENIENLVIIPDGNLLTIPFEALLSKKVKNNTEFENYPFLIKDYSVSYSYSATLWYNSLQKQKNTKSEGLLAIAPVFSSKNTAGTSMRTRSFLTSIDTLANDSIKTRGKLLNGQQVSSLPASENEVNDIFELFKYKKQSALVKTHKFANEDFIKSDMISKYRYIHIATHGFVNSEKPELSGILLAQDTTKNLKGLEQEDGILYSGEIYNLKLNADLVVLSACETGLGQMKRGEGVIGLTRALIYAGANNLIVSLWKVADESTNKLMVDFYKETLSGKKNTSKFSKHLTNAKREMIKNGKYAHPFYWSPFILIGK